MTSNLFKKKIQKSDGIFKSVLKIYLTVYLTVYSKT